ncbi:MAG TPA: hypothetical protein VML94_08270 [Thermoplasmata archaeon]|nr:hypothetical protein [Thermoplasmata archaeon]
MDTYVEREEIEVLRVRADMKGAGPAEAFRLLESKLASLRGRHFYGTIRILPEGEEYFACVQRQEGEEPERMDLELGRIPGGLYVRRKITDWESIIAAGRLPSIGREMAETYTVDPSRPEIEYYRSRKELHLLVPVLVRAPLEAGTSSRP